MYTPRKAELLAAVNKVELFLRHNSKENPKLIRAHTCACILSKELKDKIQDTPYTNGFSTTPEEN